MTGRLRGWCPSLFEPMESGDGLLVRVKPPLGRMSAAGARAIAAAARAFGNGQIELTNRGALQVRGLGQASLPPFQAAVLATGLASPDPAVERRRNILVSPFTSHTESAVVTELERWIGEDKALAALPSKFGLALGPAHDPLPLLADVCLTSLASNGKNHGATLWRISLCDSQIAGVTDAPATAARAVVHNFVRISAALDQGPQRMAELVRNCGADALFAGGGVGLDTAPSGPSEGSSAIAGAFGDSFALCLPFGAASAEQIEIAADLAERFAGNNLRLSPWRALVLPAVSDAGTLAMEARAAGFITDISDPRLSVSACAGAPGCASAHAASRADAAALAAHPLRGTLHVSGCAKGCAHPAPVTFTLVAADDGYGLIRHGRAGDPPQQRGLTLETAIQLLAAETL